MVLICSFVHTFICSFLNSLIYSLVLPIFSSPCYWSVTIVCLILGIGMFKVSLVLHFPALHPHIVPTEAE